MNQRLIFLITINLTCLVIQLNGLIDKGCKAYDCHRYCVSQDLSKTPGDNGFKFEIEGIQADKYMPGKTYTS